MKIKKLHIKNFKSIADLEIIEPNPFTVFVGPNGSGKSNIFEALEFWNFGVKGYGFDIDRIFGGLDNIIHHNYADSNNLVSISFINSDGFIIESKIEGEKHNSYPNRLYIHLRFG